MEILFANKSLLPSAYKRLFIERLTNMDKLKESIKGRYGKKEINEEAFNKIFRLSHKALFDFVGVSEESRLRIYFGTKETADQRDAQITLLDRFILDAVQFDVHQTLLTQFIDEYKTNKDLIDKEWHDLISNQKPELEIPLDYLIQRQIEATKPLVLEELQFPKNQKLRLFSLEKNTLKLNEQVFSNWIPTQKSESNLITYLIIGGSIVLALALLSMPLLFLGGTAAGLVITSASSTAKLVLSCVLGTGIFSIAGSYVINYLSNKQTPQEVHQNTSTRFNHAYLYTNLYNSQQAESNQDKDIAPFHNNKWMLEKYISGSTTDSEEEEASYDCNTYK